MFEIIIIFYIFQGTLWGIFASMIQNRVRNKSRICLTFFINLLFWPIAMIVAIRNIDKEIERFKKELWSKKI